MRWAITAIVCTAVAACGSFGASDPGPSADGGPDGEAQDSGAGPDGASIDTGTPGDAGGVSCASIECPAGSSGMCEDDSCLNGVDDASVTGEASLTTGLSDAGTNNCVARAVSPGAAFVRRTLTATGPSTYDVLFRLFEVDGAGNDSIVLAVEGDDGDRVELSTGPVVSVLCANLSGTATSCSLPFPTANLVDKRLHLHIGPKAGVGEVATLAAGCAQVTEANLPRAFLPAGGVATFEFGCVATDVNCRSRFDSMVFSVVPN